MNDLGAFGEVVEAESQAITVECHTLYHAPEFGSFIRADCVGSGRQHYGVVTRISSGPFDSNRLVQAHRLPPGELEQRKPHLPTLLRTVFSARMVGYGQGEVILPGTAPAPPRLHCFVSPAAPEQVRLLTERPDFLRPLADTPDAPLEDLLVRAIEEARKVHPADHERALLVTWGKFLARLLGKDYLTLENVVGRIAAPPVFAPVAAAAAPRPARPHPLYEQPLPIAGNGAPRGDRDPFEGI